MLLFSKSFWVSISFSVSIKNHSCYPNKEKVCTLFIIFALYNNCYVILTTFMLDSALEPSYNFSKNLLFLPWILKLKVDMVNESTPWSGRREPSAMNHYSQEDLIYAWGLGLDLTKHKSDIKIDWLIDWLIVKTWHLITAVIQIFSEKRLTSLRANTSICVFQESINFLKVGIFILSY